MPKGTDDAITPVETPPRRMQTSDERAAEGLAARRARDATPIPGAIVSGAIEAASEGDITGLHAIGAIDDDELAERRAERRRRRPTHQRIDRLETVVTDTRVIVGKVDGKLDILVADRRDGRRFRDSVWLKVIGGAIALVVALVVGYVAHGGGK